MLSTPILLIVFNRPEITQKTFNQIKKVRPLLLFVAADGPRSHKLEDLSKCAATRRIVEQIDWPCELKTLFRDDNRGCGHGPAEAISWFFDHVEQGIILEDDCVPDESFFFFCGELLEKFKDDPRVSMIGGTNPLGNWRYKKQSYVFSKLGFSWGWASWRRAWQHFDYSAILWNSNDAKERIEKHLNNQAIYDHFKSEFNLYFKEIRPDVWDFQWLLSRLHQQSYTILPTVNLISNIGFDEDSTHNFDTNSKLSHLRLESLEFPLIHPQFKVDTFFDRYAFERLINSAPRSFFKKVVLKLIKAYTLTK